MSSELILIAHARGVPIYVRRLERGDIAVWHPFSAAAQQVVEPLCRPFGRWDSHYRNWIVFRPHAARVLAGLRSLGS